MCLTKLKIVLAVLLTVGFSALLPSRFPKPPGETKPSKKDKAEAQPTPERIEPLPEEKASLERLAKQHNRKP